MRCYQAITATIFLAAYALFGASEIIPGDTLRCIPLEGFRDSQHAQWCIGFCDAKANAVVFYSTPQDKKIVENTMSWIGLKKEFYDDKGKLLKKLNVKKYDEIDGYWDRHPYRNA